MQTPELFTLLPEEYVATPDGMSIDRDGNLILSCPNFANMDLPSCVLKITRDRKITKWFDVPVNPETGEARSMGIEFGPDGDLYMVDNPGWTGREDLIRTGRILRIHFNEAGEYESFSVVADHMEHPNGLRIRNGCSFHGLALNLDMDLRPFQRINPCGYAGMPMTQLRDLVGPVDFAEVCTRLRAELVSRLGYAEQKTLTGGIELT